MVLVANFYAAGVLKRKKVVILQSKKLYHSEYGLPAEVQKHVRTVTFDQSCWYRGFSAEQFHTIDAIASEYGIPTMYLLYNPWDLPHRIELNHTGGSYTGHRRIGCRVVPASDLHSMLDGMGITSVTFALLQRIERFARGKSRGGWKTEDFVADVFLPCMEGKIVEMDDAALLKVIEDITVRNQARRRSVAVFT